MQILSTYTQKRVSLGPRKMLFQRKAMYENIKWKYRCIQTLHTHTQKHLFIKLCFTKLVFYISQRVKPYASRLGCVLWSLTKFYLHSLIMCLLFTFSYVIATAPHCICP